MVTLRHHFRCRCGAELAGVTGQVVICLHCRAAHVLALSFRATEPMGRAARECRSFMGVHAPGWCGCLPPPPPRPPPTRAPSAGRTQFT